MQLKGKGESKNIVQNTHPCTAFKILEISNILKLVLAAPLEFFKWWPHSRTEPG
jgi:hypothetical protein